MKNELKLVGFWRESNPRLESATSIFEEKFENEHEELELIYNYLLNGHFLVMTLSIGNSVLNPNTEIAKMGSVQTDGVWVWKYELAHYVGANRLELPKEFITHIESVNYETPEISKRKLIEIYESYMIQIKGLMR